MAVGIKSRVVARLVVCSLLILTQSLLIIPASAAESDAAVLKVELTSQEHAYLQHKGKLTYCDTPYWMPYSKNDSGRHIGMTSDYVAQFSKALDIEFQYIPSYSWGDTLQKAKDRSCDLVSALVDRPSRREYLDFTPGYLDTALSLATHRDAPYIDNLKALDGKRVAAVKGYASTAFIEHNFPNIVIVEVNSITQGLKLVEQSEVYGVAGTQGVLAFQIQNHYFDVLKLNGTFIDTWMQAVGTRNDEPILNSIMRKVVTAIPAQMHQDILQRWISVSVLDANTSTLTLQEKAFLAKHPVIRFRTRSNRAPFEYQIDGKAYGLAIDYVRYIANSIGFKAEFVVMDASPQEAVAELAKEDARYDSILYWVNSRSWDSAFNFGDVYLTYPVVIISNKMDHFINGLSDLNGHRVVVEQGFLTYKWLVRDYPNIELVTAPSTLAALTMVDQGKVDAYVGNLAVTNYLIASGKMENIKVAAPTEYGNIDYSFVSAKDQPELASILSKGYREITPAEHTAIRANWFTMQRVETMDYRLVLQVLGVAALLLVLSLIWSARLSRAKQYTEDALKKLQQAQNELQRRNEELRHISITDVLTGLNNRAKLEATLREQMRYIRRYPEYKFGVIMIDIDRFKVVNDTYGHHAGDEVLKRVSDLFQQYIREVDYIGRWGGEEFLVIAPHSNQRGLVLLAENLRAKLEGLELELVGRITSSFGVAVFTPGDSSESLLSRADKALYISKGKGRNCVTFL